MKMNRSLPTDRKVIAGLGAASGVVGILVSMGFAENSRLVALGVATALAMAILMVGYGVVAGRRRSSTPR